MRKLILTKYNIDHCFLFDDNIPTDYTLDNNDIVIPKTSYNPYPGNPSIPHMAIKFLKGLARINLENYDYIIRVNLSTYINFPKLHKFLESAPREKYAAGRILTLHLPDWSISPVEPVQFISGTNMIFSRDVAINFREISYDEPILLTHSDDVVLSYFAKQFTNNLLHISILLVENDMFITTEQINEYSIFRIRHHNTHDYYGPENNIRIKDIKQWENLMRMIDDIIIE